MFSWEVPIEQEILTFTKRMAENMEEVSEHHKESGFWVFVFGQNRLSKEASLMAEAYRTVQRHIEKEIELRKSVK